MTERVLDNHPRRLELTDELHARPFMPMPCPGRSLTIAFKEESNAQERDPDGDRAHLRAFIDRHAGEQAVAYPAPGANHLLADLGAFSMKWERHTEFVSYTLVEAGARDDVFSGSLMEHVPEDWLAAAPGRVVAAVEIEVLRAADLDAAVAMVNGPLGNVFGRESLVAARIMDNGALAVGDFRIHSGGFSRFAVIVHDEVGSRRIGRALQRLVEIENYRILSMLALPIARRISARLNEIDRELSALIAAVADREVQRSEKAILDDLTALSAEIEAMSASTAFRFGAARAYKSIVQERIAMLREDRLIGRQLFSEFMLRRYEPAMRTCKAAADRLSGLATRAARIASLLRTRVDVALEAQNQEVLRSMNERAYMQLRLQETVEGLSVVAISYYAVSLVGVILAPLGALAGLDKASLVAIVAVPVVLGVAWMVRRTRERITRAKAEEDAAKAGDDGAKPGSDTP
ncbi:MAG: DUF3422 domain-containing protein [Pseudomonadota bacterium]